MLKTKVLHGFPERRPFAAGLVRSLSERPLSPGAEDYNNSGNLGPGLAAGQGGLDTDQKMEGLAGGVCIVRPARRDRIPACHDGHPSDRARPGQRLVLAWQT
jgi:hypothetical protein